MAEPEDVMAAVSAKCAVAAYPNGLGQPSVANTPVLVVQGWPDASALTADLAAGKVQVSVYPLPMERNTTRFQRVWQAVSIAEPTLTLALESNQITVGGTMPAPFSPHNLAVLINGTAYLYAVQASDTLTSIATGLAASISAGWPLTTSAGTVITINGLFVALVNDQEVVTQSGASIAVGGKPPPVVTLRVGTIGQSVREVRRQKRLFQITVWAPTPDARKAVASAVDASLEKTAFITMPDGTSARVEYFDSPMTDGSSKSRLYRRDIRYFIEYATTEVANNATVVVGRVTQQDPVTGSNISITDY